MKIPVFLGTTIALVCVVDAAIASTPAEISTIAQAVTVEINLTQAQSIGSGVIVHKQGDVYTLLTNRHVVCPGKPACATALSTETFQLKFGNGSSLKVPATAVKILTKDLDLAAIQFRSSSNLQIAKFAPPGSLKVGDRVYTSGYPLEPRGYSFNTGRAISVVNKRLTGDRGGYTVVYDAQTQPGMSGGGVFDTNGRIVAIHGQGERFRENTELSDVSASGEISSGNEVGSKIGYNRGIPVRWVVRGLADRGIRLGDRDPVTPATAAIDNTADEYFIAGFNKFVEPGSNIRAGKQQAIEAFTQAIRLNPRYEYAYFLRAITYYQLKEYRLSLADYNRAIALNPNLANSYGARGILKYTKLNDRAGGIADMQTAARLAKAQGNNQVLNLALRFLQSWGVKE
ncbi:tetratricopeptide repeat-containing serine protease family protein [Chamaesiphon sp. GL140_3_metabinner_50]|uniref:tetratricopeptide repeat-containing S1 family peptidase n=1 Tax=Chamaesiphon sp. GL140_3_metabinner_50 TaxID=2970812 RepID=UPI0025EACB5D|nr:tetratricopeptide repeat-containing serine protease family protein [Chamaesiphon sp. GL140_3_metabinner_50]